MKRNNFSIRQVYYDSFESYTKNLNLSIWIWFDNCPLFKSQ